MLNAFRHQRMNHPRHPHQLTHRLCAQRLSASTNESPSGSVLLGIALEGAQRLSASTNESRGDWVQCSHVFQVLNAFRHQRMNHDGTRNKHIRGCCAQRLSASTNESPVQIVCREVSGNVLNAFRHQRMNHTTIAGYVIPSIVCSTPFGINE